MTTVSPHALYETKISSGELRPDEGQADAVMHLENLFEALKPAQQSQSFGPIRRLFGFGKQAKKYSKGPVSLWRCRPWQNDVDGYVC